MYYSQRDFEHDVFDSIKKVKGCDPTKEECLAVAHHMEYNIRADRAYADNGHLKISKKTTKMN